MTARRKHSIAYFCFLAPGALGLVMIVGAIPMNDANAAGLGFFVLIPLTLASFVTIPFGVLYSIRCRDGLLLFLSAFTLFLFVAMFAELEGTMWLWPVYGICVLILEVRWWFFLRRAYPT